MNAVTLIDFDGRVIGGNAPYVLNWYVINEASTQFLYQPLESKLENSNGTSTITVDKQPVYKVMLLATDACGNSGRQMVVVSCGTDTKKINTLFVEPLNNLNSIVDPIGH
jgi:hypothetical protein